jgi:translation initiation factor 4G
VPKAVIRPAGPEDARFLAIAMLAASRGQLQRGWYDIALGLPESGCLEFLARLSTTEAPSWWHHSHFWVAELDGAPVAALGAFGGGEAYSLSGAAMAEAGEALGLSAEEQAAAWERGSYLFLCALGSDEGWTIENVYTAPDHRGRGLAERLLERALDEGRKRGFREAQVTFFIGNEAAERAYRKAGFAFAEEKRQPDFEKVAGAPGMRRLVRILDGGP